MIKDLKIHEALTCNAENSIVEVAKQLRDHTARHAYVLDKDMKPLGIISAVDINNKVVAEDADTNQLKAWDIMNSPVDFVDIKQEVEFAMSIMMKRKTYSCLVTEDGKAKGVVDYGTVMDRIIKKLREEENGS